ncbi:toxin-antitoxin system HicB family antitoxin [Halorhodospira abdelmalekii]|uniref:type II toxin-antitoxin system HicB family antitoxin n=1 Tax=Halorhodospira abdelmalekii TaxID=421629 RepID=UPI001903A8C1|nr:type II toxin-antitoxin system HicB family antitoxin [Halorhodospira abdelmalekii]MBK1734744.1 toxin-antitoxin system HicB family antitoxin [Halorhodospira abdelmalekii]
MDKLLKYRGYYGSIEASTADNCLFGRLQFVRALVSYEGETVAELETAFRAAVDDYIATCEQLGALPEKPCKGSFNVRIGHELHLAAAVAASQHGISLNDLTRQALRSYLERAAVNYPRLKAGACESRLG